MIFLSGPITNTFRTVWLSAGVRLEASPVVLAGSIPQAFEMLRSVSPIIRVVGGVSLRLANVIRPPCVIIHGIDAEPDYLDIAVVKLRLDPSHVAEFGRADRGEVLRVRKENTPGVPKPVVKANSTFCRLRLEIWCRVANLKSHGGPLGRGAAMPPLCVAHTGCPSAGDGCENSRTQVIRSYDPKTPSVTAVPSSVGQEGASFSVRSYGD